jgi:hypothetical protein
MVEESIYGSALSTSSREKAPCIFSCKVLRISRRLEVILISALFKISSYILSIVNVIKRIFNHSLGFAAFTKALAD